MSASDDLFDDFELDSAILNELDAIEAAQLGPSKAKSSVQPTSGIPKQTKAPQRARQPILVRKRSEPLPSQSL